jgi:hypothetical protein
MKPVCQFDSRRAAVESDSVARRFPPTDYFFQSRIEEWRGFGFSSPQDGPNRFHNFRNLTREYYGAAAQEQLKEMIAFGVVVAASAWLVIYMVIVVVRLLLKGHPPV